ncbi:PEP-CTERM sorting domain-containing protein [Myxococcota bacterium]|nr:PEP-CTERM sorting domain-containing protein [Myxococcota bacterium]
MKSLIPSLTILWAVCLIGAPLTAQASALVTITFSPSGGAFDDSPRPPGATGRPDFIQQGVRYAGFRFDNPGTPSGDNHFVAHTHIRGMFQTAANGWADAPHSFRDELQGARISVEDGSKFDLVSIDYHVVKRYVEPRMPPARSQFERLPWSQPANDVAIIVAPEVEIATPTFQEFENQWSFYSIDDGTEFDNGDGTTDPSRPAAGIPMQTLYFSGFDNLEQLFIAQTGGETIFDNLVIRVHDGDSQIPEPGTALLIMTGLLWVGIRQTRTRPGAPR